MNEINQKHQSIKRDVDFSKEIVEFSETLYIGNNNILQATGY